LVDKELTCRLDGSREISDEERVVVDVEIDSDIKESGKFVDEFIILQYALLDCDLVITGIL